MHAWASSVRLILGTRWHTAPGTEAPGGPLLHDIKSALNIVPLEIACAVDEIILFRVQVRLNACSAGDRRSRPSRRRNEAGLRAPGLG